MSLLSRKFSAVEVTEITGVTKYNLQSYLTRGHLPYDKGKIEGGAVQGKPRSFLFFTVMQIALAKALIDLGMTPKAAFSHVTEFAYSGGASLEGEPGRWPGLPYHHKDGETILAVSGERNYLGSWKIGEGDFFGKALIHLSRNQGTVFSLQGAVFVNASNVFGSVCQRLGLHPFEVLDEEYKDGSPKAAPRWPEALE